MKSVKNINKKKMRGGAGLGCGMALRRSRNRTSNNPNSYHNLRSQNNECWNYCLPLACYIPAYAFAQNPDCPVYVPACTALAASSWLYNSCMR